MRATAKILEIECVTSEMVEGRNGHKESSRHSPRPHRCCRCCRPEFSLRSSASGVFMISIFQMERQRHRELAGLPWVAGSTGGEPGRVLQAVWLRDLVITVEERRREKPRRRMEKRTPPGRTLSQTQPTSCAGAPRLLGQGHGGGAWRPPALRPTQPSPPVGKCPRQRHRSKNRALLVSSMTGEMSHHNKTGATQDSHRLTNHRKSRGFWTPRAAPRGQGGQV